MQGILISGMTMVQKLAKLHIQPMSHAPAAMAQVIKNYNQQV